MHIFYLIMSYSSWEDPECCGQCSPPHVPEIPAILLVVSAKSGMWHFYDPREIYINAPFAS